MRLDPVTLEILATKLGAATEEMGYALQRSGRTLYVKETADFCTSLADLRGKLFAYPRGVGVSGAMDLDCSHTVEAAGKVAGPLEPGDVVITNHPYLSHGLSTHLPDIHLVKPYFHDGRLVCYGWTFVHSADVGGRVPSSISPSNSELFQEGLLIPPVKLVERGVMSPTVLAFVRANCRTPDENTGDLKAMVAALGVGERRVAKIIEQHGIATFEAAMTDLIAHSAEKARAAYRTIPDGVYEFADYLDDELTSPIPLRIHARLAVTDGLLDLDFAGTDPQVAAAFNIPTAGGRHTALSLRLSNYALTRDPTIPLNSGIFEPLTIRAPEGSLLNPIFPAPVGVRHASVVRLNDVLNGLLAQALPDFMRACGAGTAIPVVMAEPEDGRGRRNVIVVELMIGGTGALKGADGSDGRDAGTHNMSNNPVELVETSAAVTVHNYATRPDSGGPGRWRGGVGLELTFSPHRPGTHVLGRGMDRFRFQPWGLDGGRCGAPARTIRNRGRQDEQELGKIDMVELGPEDTITILTPGGGGYGDPLDRDPEAVLNDVVRGFVGVEAARADYGVVIAEDRVDPAATAALRERLRARRQDVPQPIAAGRVAFDLGPHRTAWESVFDKALMERIVAAVMALPTGARRAARQRIFAPVIDLLRRPGLLDREALGRAAPRVRKALVEVEGKLAAPGD